jgi:lipoate-protein ligase A
MLLLDLTLDSAAQNVALDDALLTWASQQDPDDDREVLRLWESPTAAVVIGRASRTAAEVHLENCANDEIPVIRRCSGGLAVVLGEGCLMYSVVLDLTRTPGLEMISQAHQHVLQRLTDALQSTGVDVQAKGHCDLTVNDRKFSGNALRITRQHLLYHGTILYDFDLSLITRYLQEPHRQPDYREQRPHTDFVCNISATADQLRSALREAWGAERKLAEWPSALTSELVATKYGQTSWNLKR